MSYKNEWKTITKLLKFDSNNVFIAVKLNDIITQTFKLTLSNLYK